MFLSLINLNLIFHSLGSCTLEVIECFFLFSSQSQFHKYLLTGISEVLDHEQNQSFDDQKNAK